jgi:hypothetical protein
MKINICFYTNKKFRDIESYLIEDLKSKGFDNVFNYRSEDVKQGDFYIKNKELLDLERGDGYWVWKPKIILETLEKMEYGDVLFYIDAGDYINNNDDDDDIFSVSKEYFKTEDYYFTNWHHGSRKHQIQHTKRDCFILMGCDDEKYHNTRQIEAGFIAVKKTNKMIEFINEYLFYCKNKNIINDDKSVFGDEHEQFKCHRHDQSILTNLIVKHNFSFSDKFIANVIHNKYTP